MKHPRYVSQVCANVLFALGVIFLVLEVLLPRDVVLVYTGAGNLTLWLGGLVLILAGAGFALKAWRRSRRDKTLLAQGSAVPGTVLDTRRYPLLSWNSRSYVPGSRSRSPWCATCEYTVDGQTYQVKTGLLWFRPESGGSVTVHVDPQRPHLAAVKQDTLHRAYAEPTLLEKSWSKWF